MSIAGTQELEMNMKNYAMYQNASKFYDYFEKKILSYIVYAAHVAGIS